MEQVRKQLRALGEEDYKKFNEKIVPGAKNMLGVRLPKVREIAKAKAKENPLEYLEEIETALCENRDAVCYEEIMVYGLVIGYAKLSDEDRMMWLDRFLKHIDNWAVCDSCCMTYKWMKKNPAFWWDYLISCIEKGTEYSIRVAVVCMLDHFVNDEYVDRVLYWCGKICSADMPFQRRNPSANADAAILPMDSDSAVGISGENPQAHFPADMPYYVQMAVAWAVSVCYVKYPKQTHEFLKESQMDVFTHNKSIQKICESFRVTKEQKSAVRKLKR